MEQVWEFFQNLFNTSGFPPRWHCGKWSDFHGWLYIISDLLIWSAYFAMPIIIVRYISKKQGLRFERIYFLFAAFILACGATHLLDAIIFWYPFYRVSALVRFATGIISWTTVYYLVKIMPTAFSLKSAEQLEEEVERRKKVEEQLRINNSLLTEAQSIARLGHWQWDATNKNVTWSETLQDIFEMQEQKDHTYQDYLALIHPEDIPYLREMISRAVETKVFPEFYHRLILKDGRVKTIHAKGQVITNKKGEIIIIGTAQDVTDLKKNEQELLAKTKALEASNVELEKFASIASHDLREPLRKIGAYSSMLEHDQKELLNEKGKLYLEKIQSASARMQQLIDDILDFSRLTTEQSEFKRTNLNEVIAAVLSDLEVPIVTTHAEIQTENLPTVEGNASQLGQLFFNLINNAVKFRKPGTAPLINISSIFIKGKDLPADPIKLSQYKFAVLGNPRYWENELFCQISVSDNGIGFDETYLDRIFMIFQRLHGKTDYEGTGIGLAVCKKVVDIHHGSITARSTPGAGATFIVLLPVSQKNFTVSSMQ
ncbi:MAG: ATP-binding protein [Flavipsychrobacter sp.]|nr:ATP-binding protein [Flavipsychrobacter sp.]